MMSTMPRILNEARIIPLFLSPVAGGFPSPATDYIEQNLDLNEYLIKHPAATFFVRVSGNSMIRAGIFSGDILIVDKSLNPKQDSIIVAILNGEFTVKRFRKEQGKIILYPENEKYLPTTITEGMDFQIWGVVTNVIHKL
jgi:DNA polymerase V